MDVAPNLILQKEAERTENAALSPFALLPPVESFVVLDLDKRDLGQFPPTASPDFKVPLQHRIRVRTKLVDLASDLLAELRTLPPAIWLSIAYQSLVYRLWCYDHCKPLGWREKYLALGKGCSSGSGAGCSLGSGSGSGTGIDCGMSGPC